MTQSHIHTHQPDSPRRFRGMFAVIFMINLLLGSAATYADDFSKEDAVKAAFILHFAHFVEWPADRPKTITIGVLGEDPFNGALETINGKTVNASSASAACW